MTRLRVALIALGVVLGVVLNVTVAPQLMTPRPPVFNGPDIAENWEWRSMAIQNHSWWLSEQHPDARVERVGYTTPPGRPDALEVGMEFQQWFDPILGLDVNSDAPPFDVSELGIRDDLLAYQQVYSRIHCRSDQTMEQSDTCYYFVAWDPATIPADNPVFIGVKTRGDKDEEEMALIEQGLLERVSPVPLDQLLAIDEVR